MEDYQNPLLSPTETHGFPGLRAKFQPPGASPTVVWMTVAIDSMPSPNRLQRAAEIVLKAVVRFVRGSLSLPQTSAVTTEAPLSDYSIKSGTWTRDRITLRR